MSIYLEITQLPNGDVVLREAEDDAAGPQPTAPAQPAVAGQPFADPAERREPLVRISFSDEVRDMLGDELVGVAEAMIDAATEFLGAETIEIEADTSPVLPIVH